MKRCVPCRGGVPPLSPDQARELFSMLAPGWEIVDDHHLRREVRRKNFRQALDLANRIGEIAEGQQHHPDLLVSWGRLTVTLYTHAVGDKSAGYVGGLHENDFIMAARIDALLESERPGGATSASGGATPDSR